MIFHCKMFMNIPKYLLKVERVPKENTTKNLSMQLSRSYHPSLKIAVTMVTSKGSIKDVQDNAWK